MILTKYHITLLILVGICFSIVGDLFLKKSAAAAILPLSIGIMLYSLSAIPVAILLARTDFSIVFLLWEVITTIVAVSISVLAFHEPLTTHKLAALMLAIAALYLIYY